LDYLTLPKAVGTRPTTTPTTTSALTKMERKDMLFMFTLHRFDFSVFYTVLGGCQWIHTKTNFIGNEDVKYF